MTLDRLTTDELLARLRAHVGRGNVWLVGLLAYLGEMDARRAYAEHACSSTWDFCVRRLGMSEGEAIRRIAAARVLRQFPISRGYVLRGELHLSAVYEIHKHLTPENHEELLREAAGKSTKVVAAIIAARFPKPDVHACVEPLAPQPALPQAQAHELGGAKTAMDREQGTATLARRSPEPARSASASAGSLPPVPAPKAERPFSSVEPLSATRYRVVATISTETKEKLDRIRDLMRHRNPTGDLERVFDAALTLLLAKLEKERLGKTARSIGTSPSAKHLEAPPRGVVSSRRRGDASPRDVAARDVPGSEEPALAAPDEPAATPVGCQRKLQGHGPAEASVHDSAERDRPGSLTSVHDSQEQERPPPFTAEASVHDSQEQERPPPFTAESPVHDSILASPRATGMATATKTKNVRKGKSAAVDVKKNEPQQPKKKRRHIPRAIRREVFARDGEQCTFVDAAGHRCPERGYLELDHIEPQALGGPDTAANLRARCRAHNMWHAAQVFGQAHIEKRIHLRRRWSATPGVRAFDEVARGLRSLGFREPEVRAAMSQLQAKVDPSRPTEEILREALRLLT